MDYFVINIPVINQAFMADNTKRNQNLLLLLILSLI